MRNKINAVKTIIGILLVSLVCLSTADAEILLGDHFDSQPDWNTSQDSGLLSIWSGSLAQNRGGNFEAGYISPAGAHGGSGKGFIQYWDQASGYAYAQDIWLMKSNVNFPNEWYLGYWFQVDPQWDWGSASNLKLLKVHFDDGETWDIFWTGFCAGCEDWRLPDGAIRSLCTDQWGKNWAGRWSDLGSEWHYFVWHFNHSEGTLELFVDGQPAMQTEYPTNYPGTGWDSNYGISFGGNITNGGGGVNEMWTKFDDVVIATTQSEVENFLGVSSSTPPPAETPEDIDDDSDGYTENQGDCNDADNSIYPGAAEICGDGIDQDCNGIDLACSQESTDVSVLFNESFDDSNLVERGWYDGGSSNATIVYDSEAFGKCTRSELFVWQLQF